MKETKNNFLTWIYKNLNTYIKNKITSTVSKFKTKLLVILDNKNLSDNNKKKEIINETTLLVNEILDPFSFLIKHISNLIIWFINSILIYDEWMWRHLLNVWNMVFDEIDYLLKQEDNEKYFDKEIYELKNKYIIRYIYLISSFFHDIWKFWISKNDLNYPWKSSDESYIRLKEHVNFSKEILEIKHELFSKFIDGIIHFSDLIKWWNELNELISKYVVKWAEEHHEKVNWNWYPNKLNWEEISKMAQLITIIDIFESTSSQRIYQEKRNSKKDYFLNGLFRLFLDKDWLDKVLLEKYLEKFWITNFYNYDEVTFLDEIVKVLDFKKNRFIKKEINRIEKSLSLSNKTITESNEALIIEMVSKLNNNWFDLKSIDNINNLLLDLWLNKERLINFATFKPYLSWDKTVWDLIERLLKKEITN